jgi:8-oxo-dGTP pyrophosphatase MutT (NUDIX family)
MMEVFAQAGAIPCRTVNGALEVLLITTSSGKNMTIPKGLVDPGVTVVETVHNEAMEEAGIRGRLFMPAIGTYLFEKWGGICRVRVFVMMVEEEMDDWPESWMRRRTWMACCDAAGQVKHKDLGSLILKVPAVLTP